MILELCKGVHCVDLGESFQTHIYLQKFVSIQPRTSPLKFAASRDNELRSLPARAANLRRRRQHPWHCPHGLGALGDVEENRHDEQKRVHLPHFGVVDRIRDPASVGCMSTSFLVVDVRQTIIHEPYTNQTLRSKDW